MFYIKTGIVNYVSPDSDTGVVTTKYIIGNTGLTRWVDKLAELLSHDVMREEWNALVSAAKLEHNIERHAFRIAESLAAHVGVPLTVWTSDND
jgi:hypothetical protein